MKVINLWAGPGAGKSTTAAGLFHIVKSYGLKAELVTEYAKELVYEGAKMDDQLDILAQQNKRLRRLQGHVDWVITDSPLPLGLAYLPADYQQSWFEEAVKGVFRGYDNVNVLIKRVKAYKEYGRKQTEDQARALDANIEKILNEMAEQEPLQIEGDALAPSRIYRKVFEQLDY